MMLKNGITGLLHGLYIAERMAFFRVANVSSILRFNLALGSPHACFFLYLTGYFIYFP